MRNHSLAAAVLGLPCHGQNLNNKLWEYLCRYGASVLRLLLTEDSRLATHGSTTSASSVGALPFRREGLILAQTTVGKLHCVIQAIICIYIYIYYV